MQREAKDVFTNFEDEKFSYLIIRRGERPAKPAVADPSKASEQELSNESYYWDRVTRKPLRKKQHVIVDVCSHNGEMERQVIPKSYGRSIYGDAKDLTWGDLWPHTRDADDRPSKKKDDAETGKELLEALKADLIKFNTPKGKKGDKHGGEGLSRIGDYKKQKKRKEEEKQPAPEDEIDDRDFEAELKEMLGLSPPPKAEAQEAGDNLLPRGRKGRMPRSKPSETE